jgi:hypothetical protein
LFPLGDVAVHVRLGGAVPDRLAGQGCGAFAVEVRVGVLVDERLDRDAEFTAVLERQVVLRKPARARVHVLAGRERRPLGVAGQIGLHGAAADRPVPAARTIAGFQQRDLVAGLEQFVRRGQAGDPGPEDDDVLAAATVQVDPRRSGVRGGLGRAGQAEGRHRRVHDTGSTGDTDLLQELTSGLGHAFSSLGNGIADQKGKDLMFSDCVRTVTT